MVIVQEQLDGRLTRAETLLRRSLAALETAQEQRQQERLAVAQQLRDGLAPLQQGISAIERLLEAMAAADGPAPLPWQAALQEILLPLDQHLRVLQQLQLALDSPLLPAAPDAAQQDLQAQLLAAQQLLAERDAALTQARQALLAKDYVPAAEPGLPAIFSSAAE